MKFIYIFFLIIALSSSAYFLQGAEATHYADIGEDDIWYIHEWDRSNIYDPLCFYPDGINDDGVDEIQAHVVYGL